MRLFIPSALFLLLAGANIFPETVYHLIDNLSVKTGDVALSELITEKLPVANQLRLKAGKTYSNAEISAILLNMGFRDFILIGNSAEVKVVTDIPENTVPEIPGTDTPGTVLSVRPEFQNGPDGESFFLRVVDRNSGDAVLRKGPITIVSRVKILRRSGEGYLVQNPFSGRKFTIRADDGPQAD